MDAHFKITDIALWYALGLAAFAALCTALCVLRVFIRYSKSKVSFDFLKHVFYPHVWLPFLGKIETTHFELLLATIIISANILCNTLGVSDKASLVKRSGYMSIINLIPLALGSHMNLVASQCGMRLDSWYSVHRWTGWISLLEALTHLIAALLDRKMKSGLDKAGIAAAALMGTIFLASLPPLRRHFYEIFAKTHLILTAAAVAGVWIHSSNHGAGDVLTKPPIVYMVAAIGLWAVTLFVRILFTLYRNSNCHRLFSVAQLHHLPDAVQAHIKVTRPWEFRAGEYVYLCIPSASRTAILQAHPCAVSWWYRDQGGCDTIVLVIQKKEGFSKSLYSESQSPIGHPEGLKAIVEGPYGKGYSLDSFGTILLFATGIGVVGLLPFVKELMDGYWRFEVKVRKIVLFWEIETEGQLLWVKEWMQKLIDDDCGHILDIRLFPGEACQQGSGGDDQQAPKGDIADAGSHALLTRRPYKLDTEHAIRTELQRRPGKALVATCANAAIANQGREAVRRLLNHDVQFIELEFHPD